MKVVKIIEDNITTKPLNQNRMTPREKAKELFDKMYQVFVDDEDQHFVDVSKRISKKMLFILVDEFLYKPTPKQKTYWQQVKKELLNFKSGICCPNCNESENIHVNYDYSKEHKPVESYLCNECGAFFTSKLN